LVIARPSESQTRTTLRACGQVGGWTDGAGGGQTRARTLSVNPGDLGLVLPIDPGKLVMGVPWGTPVHWAGRRTGGRVRANSTYFAIGTPSETSRGLRGSVFGVPPGTQTFSSKMKPKTGRVVRPSIEFRWHSHCIPCVRTPQFICAKLCTPVVWPLSDSGTTLYSETPW